MSTAAKKYGPASPDRLGTQASTAARKQKAPAQTPIEARPRADQNFADNASVSLSAFEQALNAARDLLLGPPEGEPGKIGELENETWGCERSTAEAILGTQPTEKRSAFYHGFDELREKLCAAATKYYNTCFELALSNGVLWRPRQAGT